MTYNCFHSLAYLNGTYPICSVAGMGSFYYGGLVFLTGNGTNLDLVPLVYDPKDPVDYHGIVAYPSSAAGFFAFDFTLDNVQPIGVAMSNNGYDSSVALPGGLDAGLDLYGNHRHATGRWSVGAVERTP